MADRSSSTEKPISPAQLEKDSTPSLSASDELSSDYNPTNIKEKALLRRLDLKLLPPLCLLYLLSFLDRSNIGNAKIEGLTTELSIGGNQYLDTLTIYFIGYVLFEIPCNIILKKTSPRFWLPTLMFAWGVVATLLGVTQNFAGFMVARFFLGVTESGLFPGITFYLSMWYKREERQYRIALLFSAASLAGAFGGILAFGIGHLSVGDYHGWRWIFILEGLLTIVVAIGAYFFIFNYPETVKWLSEDEREFIVRRVGKEESFNWAAVREAFTDVKCWLYGLAFHTMSLPLYTLSLFLPQIIKDLGYSAANAQLLTVPPYAVATILTVIVAIVSEKAKKRAIFIIGTSSLAIIGYIMLLCGGSAGPGLSYAGTILAAAGIYPSTAIVLSWPANNVAGQTKRATANALQISIGNLGAVLGTQLYRPSTSPRYYLGHSFAVGYLLANICVVGTLWIVLARENKKKSRLGDGKVLSDRDGRWIFQT